MFFLSPPAKVGGGKSVLSSEESHGGDESRHRVILHNDSDDGILDHLRQSLATLKIRKMRITEEVLLLGSVGTCR